MPLKDIPEGLLNHPETAKVAMESQNTTDANKLQSGWLGGVFGVGENATINYMGMILFLIVVSLLGMGIVDFITKDGSDISKYTDVWIPIVTSIIGFIFGKKASS